MSEQLEEQKPAEVTIDGVGTPLSELGPEVQQMVMILNRWKTDQEVAMLEKMKIDAAVRNLSDSVVATVRKHREDKLVTDDGDEVVVPETPTSGSV